MSWAFLETMKTDTYWNISYVQVSSYLISHIPSHHITIEGWDGMGAHPTSFSLSARTNPWALSLH